MEEELQAPFLLHQMFLINLFEARKKFCLPSPSASPRDIERLPWHLLHVAQKYKLYMEKFLEEST